MGLLRRAAGEPAVSTVGSVLLWFGLGLAGVGVVALLLDDSKSYRPAIALAVSALALVASAGFQLAGNLGT